MSKRFHHGLVVGKFCPLHRGHEYLINQARNACRHVWVISYTKPDFDRCEASRRKAWLEARFPDVHVLVLDQATLAALAIAHQGPWRQLPDNDAPPATHRALCVWLCRAVFKTRMDAVFTSEAYGDGFAAALCADLRDHDAGYDGMVTHVSVDPARGHVPISGRLIRARPHHHRQFLAPEVYADFVEKVCFLGGESTGKSTLAATLARRHDTVSAAEYGRERWEERDGKLTYADLLLIARTQVARENNLARQANHWLFCDTSPLTTLLYCLDLFGRAPPELEALANRHYDHVFLCAPDFPLVQDGTRRDEAFRHRQHAWYFEQLQARGIRWQLLHGPLDTRIRAVEQALGCPCQSA